MKPTSIRALALTLVIFAAVTWAVLKGIYSSLPPLTWTAVPALLIAAAVEAWLGWDLRGRILGKRVRRPMPALFVARMVALAKATSQTAALIAGVCAGFMIFLAGMTSAPTPRADLIDASISLGAALVLMAAALFLEHCCRVPPHDDADDEVPPPPRPSPFHH